MRMDERCKRLNELNDKYHQLFRVAAERQLTRVCERERFHEPLCMGDALLMYLVMENGDEPANMADISRRLKINPSTATRRVNRLQANGLVTKSAAQDDDRRYDLKLTAAGSRLVNEMDEWMFETVQNVYEPVTDSEMQAVYAFLNKCIGQLEAMLQDNQSSQGETWE